MTAAAAPARRRASAPRMREVVDLAARNDHFAVQTFLRGHALDAPALCRAGRDASCLWQTGDVGATALGEFGHLVNAHFVFTGLEIAETVEGGSVLMDRDGTAHTKYGVQHPCFYLVRPDGHVGFRGSVDSAGHLVAYLFRIGLVARPPASTAPAESLGRRRAFVGRQVPIRHRAVLTRPVVALRRVGEKRV